MADPILDAATHALTARHGCHTVLLYGSRARGDATPDSDYDLIGFRDAGPARREAYTHDGAYIDAFIYPESDAAEPAGLLHVRGGLVLRQRDGFGDRLLAALDACHAAGPPPWPADERAAFRVWCDKMIARAGRGDLEGRYRRGWLVFELLEVYFKARGRWYEGSKAAFAWLATHDPETHAAFDAALAPNAPLSAVETLVTRVWTI